jgi:hypothetical protein
MSRRSGPGSPIKDMRQHRILQRFPLDRGASSDPLRAGSAVAWLGRSDDTLDDWDELRAEAARQHNNRTASYLLGMPLLPDFLAEGLAKFELSCEDLED